MTIEERLNAIGAQWHYTVSFCGAEHEHSRPKGSRRYHDAETCPRCTRMIDLWYAEYLSIVTAERILTGMPSVMYHRTRFPKAQNGEEQ